MGVLIHGVSSVVIPQINSLGGNDLVKLVLAAACYGESPFMESLASEVSKRLSDFVPAHLMLLTQGLIQGLGVSHQLLAGVFDYWIEFLSETQATSRKDEDSVNS